MEVDVDRGVKMTMIQAHIIQKCNLGGGGAPSELDGVAAIETFKELGERVGNMRSKDKDGIDKMQ